MVQFVLSYNSTCAVKLSSSQLTKCLMPLSVLSTFCYNHSMVIHKNAVLSRTDAQDVLVYVLNLQAKRLENTRGAFIYRALVPCPAKAPTFQLLISEPSPWPKPPVVISGVSGSHGTQTRKAAAGSIRRKGTAGAPAQALALGLT